MDNRGVMLELQRGQGNAFGAYPVSDQRHDVQLLQHYRALFSTECSVFPSLFVHQKVVCRHAWARQYCAGQNQVPWSEAIPCDEVGDFLTMLAVMQDRIGRYADSDRVGKCRVSS